MFWFVDNSGAAEIEPTPEQAETRRNLTYNTKQPEI